MKILSQNEEPLLARTRIHANIVFEKATPSTAKVKKQLATSTKKDEKLIVIKKIATHYGSKEADIDAVIYTSEKEMNNLEKKPKKQREAEKKAAEEAAKKAKEEAATPTEEPKPEEKPATEEKKEEKTE